MRPAQARVLGGWGAVFVLALWWLRTGDMLPLRLLQLWVTVGAVLALALLHADVRLGWLAPKPRPLQNTLTLLGHVALCVVLMLQGEVWTAYAAGLRMLLVHWAQARVWEIRMRVRGLA